MSKKWRGPAWAVVLLVSIVPSARAELTDAQVREAIRRGVDLLKREQAADGSWSDHTVYAGGVTALCSLALLSAGEDPDSPALLRSLASLRALEQPKTVYVAALQTMVFCAADPDRDAVLIGRNVQWLQQAQIAGGPQQGAWSYGDSSRGDQRGSGDNSNTQFAIMALYEAERVGVPVREETWRRAADYWRRTQHEDGSWGYTQSEPATGSMTCAGISCLIICLGRLRPGDARVEGDEVQCCAPRDDDQALLRGLQWLGAHFSATSNPSAVAPGRHHLLYYLYGVERVGRLTGSRFIGRHDWYRAGATTLLNMRDAIGGGWISEGSGENVPVIATSFALLFLSKGRRPVVLSKVRYDDRDDWDAHRSGVHHLTRRVESRWKRDLTWQTIDLRAAAVDDLMESPILFLSGRDEFSLGEDQKRNLRQFVNQGGFLFAEACCGGTGFDRSFRQLMKELFPDSGLRLLPADHPIWHAEQKVDANHTRPLLGVDTCCRTSVVYCPEDLSCYWELSQGPRESTYPARVQAEVEACLRIGANVVTYATSRELKNKLDRPAVSPTVVTESLDRGVLYVPKIRHDGGGDDAPNAVPNMLNFVRQQTQTRLGIENRVIPASDESLSQYPIVYMHGRRAFQFSDTERQALARFLQRGGVILADSICANAEFSQAFRRELAAILPGAPLTRIAPDHPMFTREYRGYDLPQVTLRDPEVRAEGDGPLRGSLTKISPHFEGIELDGRYAVIFSPYDISCAMENSASLECKGYVKEDAARLMTNLLLFALSQ